MFGRERQLRQGEIGDGADRGISGAIEEVIEVGFQAFALLPQGDLHVEHLGFFQAGLVDILLHPLANRVLGLGNGHEVGQNPQVLVNDFQGLVHGPDLVVGLLDHAGQFQLALFDGPFVGLGLILGNLLPDSPFAPERELLGDADHLGGLGILVENETAHEPAYSAA